MHYHSVLIASYVYAHIHVLLARICMQIIILYLAFISAFKKWTALITGRYMITVMMILCYVNLSGMSLECIEIVLMNKSLLGGQTCTDSVDIQQNGTRLSLDRLAIIPRLHFTCNGRITSIRARVTLSNRRSDFLSFQLWRPSSVDPTVYNKVDGSEVQLQSDNQVTRGSNDFREANIFLIGDNTIEFQSGDVVGYYHPPDTRYRVINIPTDGYILYRFDLNRSLVPTSVNLNGADGNVNNAQPLIQFTIGKCAIGLSTLCF